MLDKRRLRFRELPCDAQAWSVTKLSCDEILYYLPKVPNDTGRQSNYLDLTSPLCKHAPMVVSMGFQSFWWRDRATFSEILSEDILIVPKSTPSLRYLIKLKSY